jgi:hypothetical protein
MSRFIRQTTQTLDLLELLVYNQPVFNNVQNFHKIMPQNNTEKCFLASVNFCDTVLR